MLEASYKNLFEGIYRKFVSIRLLLAVLSLWVKGTSRLFVEESD